MLFLSSCFMSFLSGVELFSFSHFQFCIPFFLIFNLCNPFYSLDYFEVNVIRNYLKVVIFSISHPLYIHFFVCLLSLLFLLLGRCLLSNASFHNIYLEFLVRTVSLFVFCTLYSIGLSCLWGLDSVILRLLTIYIYYIDLPVGAPDPGEP